VAVEKLIRAKLSKNKIALRCRTNDFLNFLGISYAPNFWLFGRKLEFFNSHGIYHQLTRKPESKLAVTFSRDRIVRKAMKLLGTLRAVCQNR
jgi:hypothetical protein